MEHLGEESCNQNAPVLVLVLKETNGVNRNTTFLEEQ